MTKKIAIGAKPAPQHVDRWVDKRAMEDSDRPQEVDSEPVKMKRLTIDIPEALHRKFKSKTGGEGKQMAELVRSWIEGYCDS